MNGRERPTAPVDRIDLSAARSRASAAPASTRESTLFHAYRGLTSGARTLPARRTEDCACGESITAEWGWEAAAVDEHNARPRHQAWRAWRAVE